jgi:recombinational DNA repair protein RecT
VVGPYQTKNGNVAQFQLGYQGLATLFYRAGGQKIRAELVREKDVFEYENGEIKHKIDIFKSNKERGPVVGAYAIATMQNGQEIGKAMNITDIMSYKEFSKTKDSSFSPWNESQDPEGWMIKKTVLKQLGKLLPKNETINRAIAADNQDSIMHDRIEAAKKESESLKMGSVLENKTTETTDGEVTESTPVGIEPTYEPIIDKPATPETPAKKAMREAAEKVGTK